MKVYTANPSEKKGKFELQPDGTLGHTPVRFQHSIPCRPDNLAPIRGYETYLSPYSLPPYFDNVTHVDWFRATATGSDVLFTIAEIMDLLIFDDAGEIDTDIAFRHLNKGLHGYTEQHVIRVETDKGAINVGSIAFESDPMSSMCGVLFELSGAGLDYLRLSCPNKIGKLKDYLSGYGYRISRIDIALDLPGDYCREHGFTVPSIYASHLDNRIFDPASGSRSMFASQNGDWGWALAGRAEAVPYQEYNPAELSPKGLTANIGSRQCANYFRVYEKGKQIISTAELGDDHDIDKWDVRIEQEIKKQKHLPPIPWDILTHPDYFFALGRPARDFMTDYRSTLQAEVIHDIDRARYERHKKLSVERKAFWGRRAYGRLIHTMLEEGLTKEAVCDLLVRDVGLKDYVYDIGAVSESFGLVDVYPKSVYEQLETSETARKVRESYGLWQDFLFPEIAQSLPR